MNDTDVAPGTGRTIFSALRGLAGAVALVLGLTWILLTMHGPGPFRDITVGTVLAAGGLVLLMPHRLPLPARVTTLTAAATATVGALAGLLTERSQTGGMFGYVAARGWPFEWLARGAVADDPQTARAMAEQATWQVDAVNLVTDLVFWGLVGLVVAALVNKVRFRT